MRVLMVSTDGAENASQQYLEDQIIQTIEQNQVVIIMLGALFADLDTLKRLAGRRGVYVYARGYGRLKSEVAGLIESVAHLSAVRLPKEAARAEVTLEIAGQTLVIAPP